MSIRSALGAALASLFGRMRASRPTAPPLAHLPPEHCRKIVRNRHWTWLEFTVPFCTCADAAMVEGDLPPVKHRELYADRFEVDD